MVCPWLPLSKIRWILNLAADEKHKVQLRRELFFLRSSKNYSMIPSHMSFYPKDVVSLIAHLHGQKTNILSRERFEVDTPVSKNISSILLFLYSLCSINLVVF
jgi:hypothetical protein